ncbi:MAG: hypothetical protein KC516_03735 [Nanoarchaeota archaeon]|nr:hypothetical protein [Nanoarchaeota archaeon]
MAKRYLVKSITTLIIFSVAVIAAAAYFLFSEALSGVAFLILGLAGLGISSLVKIEMKSIYPDIVFGLIDNGILVFSAVLGGIYGGIAGAVIGGVAGNTITDGIGGIFEGIIVEKQKADKLKYDRNSFSTMIGKVIGCLIGAGIGLLLIELTRWIF